MRCLSLLAALSIGAAAPALASQTGDEANRQRAMASMRDQAARADRSAFQASLDRQQSIANAARAPASSGQRAASPASGGTGYAGGATTSGSIGRQSVVATRTITISGADAPQLVIAKLEREAAAGDSAAAFDLGRIFNSDYPFPRNAAKARGMFAVAARAGHAGAQASYGTMLAEGTGGPADVAGGVDWMRRSADAGNAFGQLKYGMALIAKFKDPGYDGTAAVRYLALAAEAGEMPAQAMLGTVYLWGMGVPIDDAKAARYLKLASDAGENESISLLGSLYAAGRGGGTKEEGYRLIRKAADGGSVDSQRIYGQMLLNGMGFAEDKPAGARLIKRAAEAGDATAAALLGSLYADGDGLSQDDALALRWWGIAAKRGHAGAKAQVDSLTPDQRRIAMAATE